MFVLTIINAHYCGRAGEELFWWYACVDAQSSPSVVSSGVTGAPLAAQSSPSAASTAASTVSLQLQLARGWGRSKARAIAAASTAASTADSTAASTAASTASTAVVPSSSGVKVPSKAAAPPKKPVAAKGQRGAAKGSHVALADAPSPHDLEGLSKSSSSSTLVQAFSTSGSLPSVPLNHVMSSSSSSVSSGTGKKANAKKHKKHKHKDGKKSSKRRKHRHSNSSESSSCSSRSVSSSESEKRSGKRRKREAPFKPEEHEINEIFLQLVTNIPFLHRRKGVNGAWKFHLNKLHERGIATSCSKQKTFTAWATRMCKDRYAFRLAESRKNGTGEVKPSTALDEVMRKWEITKLAGKSPKDPLQAELMRTA